MRKIILCFVFTLFEIITFAQIDTSNKFNANSLIDKAFKTIITHEEIISNYGRSLSALLNEQAGIVVNGAYQPMGSFINVYMEGFVGGKVLIEIDGLPVFDPSSIAENYFDLNFIPLNTIEEIIIERGSNSTTDGSGAVAGLINIITRKKEIDKKVNLLGQVGVGNERTIANNVQLWGKLKKFNYQLNYSSYKTAGFSYAQDSTRKSGFDNDGFKCKVLNAQLEYQLNQNVSFLGYYLKSKYRADSDEDGFNDDKNFWYKNSFTNTGIGFKYSKKDFLIQGNYKYSDAARSYREANVETEKLNGISQLVNLTGQKPLTKRLVFGSGIDCRYIQFNDQFTDVTVGIIKNAYPTTFQVGGYVSLKCYSLDNKNIVTFGYRINHHNQAGIDNAYFIADSYLISRSITLFSKISTGFTTPSIYSSSDSSLGNRNIASEKSIDYRLGMQLIKSNFNHKLSVFYHHLPNGIDYNNNTNAYSNINGFKVFGIEYESGIVLSNCLKLQLNYCFTTGNESALSRENSVDTVSYNYLIRIPQHTVNSSLRYEIKPGRMIGFSLKCVSQYKDVGTNGDYLMNGFLLVNLNSSYKINKQISINGNIQNLMNSNFHDTRGYNSTPFLAHLSVIFKV